MSTEDEERCTSQEEVVEEEVQEDSSFSASAPRIGRRSSDFIPASRAHRLALNLKSGETVSKHLSERSLSVECSNLPPSPSCESLFDFFCIRMCCIPLCS